MIYLVDLAIIFVVTFLFFVFIYRLEEGKWPWEV